MKQVIVARKDLNMSPGKLAAQVAHASMVFLTNNLRANYTKVLNCEVGYAWTPQTIRESKTEKRKPQLYRRNDLSNFAENAREKGEDYFYFRPVDPANPYGPLMLCEPTYHYRASMEFDVDTWEQWIQGSFTKVICEAKNRNQLMKAVTIAEELGLKEGKDFFLIKDNCRTELEPEEIDENGVGRTLTCIGFKPLEDEMANKISKKFQLFK